MIGFFEKERILEKYLYDNFTKSEIYQNVWYYIVGNNNISCLYDQGVITNFDIFIDGDFLTNPNNYNFKVHTQLLFKDKEVIKYINQAILLIDKQKLRRKKLERVLYVPWYKKIFRKKKDIK